MRLPCGSKLVHGSQEYKWLDRWLVPNPKEGARFFLDEAFQVDSPCEDRATTDTPVQEGLVMRVLSSDRSSRQNTGGALGVAGGQLRVAGCGLRNEGCEQQ